MPRSVKDPLETNNVNVDGTLNVLVAARDANVKRVVFAGSSAVYGETPTLPKSEKMPPSPISPYGISKMVGEVYGQAQRVYGLEFVTLRYFNDDSGRDKDPGSPVFRSVVAIQRGRSGRNPAHRFMGMENNLATSRMSQTPFHKQICWRARQKGPPGWS